MTTIKKSVIYSSLAVIVILLGLAIVFRHSIADHFSNQDAKQEAQSQLDAKRKADQQTISPTPATAPATEPVKDPGTTPSTNPGNSTTAKRIDLSANQSDGNVIVMSKLYNFTDGNCSLTAKTTANTVTQTAAVIFSRDFSTCAGFTVPVSGPGKGIWNIALTVTSGGETTSKTISLEVK